MDKNHINSAKTLFEETEKIKTTQYKNRQPTQCVEPYMREIPLLSQEQIELLQWFKLQTEGMTQLEILHACPPGYTWERVVDLRKHQLVTRYLGVENGQAIELYKINDKGRDVLLEIEQKRLSQIYISSRSSREVIEIKKQSKKGDIQKWLKDNCLNLIGILIAFLTLIATIVPILKPTENESPQEKTKVETTQDNNTKLGQ